MITNAAITVYQLNEDDSGYNKQFFPAVSYHNSIKAVSAHNGLEHVNLFYIRIPTTEEISIKIGDYIQLGDSPADKPNRAVCMKVVGLSDNRRGTLHHWKVVCA